jgi:DNA-binding transcriptional MocR family regulator
VELKEIVAAIDDRTARGIAAALARLIREGRLAVGTRLPTVREIASEIGTSPATVSEAWQALARLGALEARGRAGTYVRAQPELHGPLRYRRTTEGPGHYLLDLSTGTPDADLLPDLRPILAGMPSAQLTQTYLDEPLDHELAAVLGARWPFVPEALTAVDGCLDALDRISALLVGFGDRVVVENPAFPPLLDLLDDLGAELLPVELDDEGIVPASLAAAMASAPVALFVQPRAQNPSGVSMSEARARVLAPLLADHGTVVVEDDHAGDIASAPLVSFGTWLPERTVHVSGFSKSHGPDLRLAAVGGAAWVVDGIISRRRLGPGWSSRLLQRVLATMLCDDDTIAAVARARDIYAERRHAVVHALDERGVHTTGSDGINLWTSVANEQRALVTLASKGVGASPGTAFEVDALQNDHLRLTVGLVRDGVSELADTIAAAALGRRPPLAPRSR